jgi:hypothetical protein
MCVLPLSVYWLGILDELSSRLCGVLYCTVDQFIEQAGRGALPKS